MPSMGCPEGRAGRVEGTQAVDITAPCGLGGGQKNQKGKLQEGPGFLRATYDSTTVTDPVFYLRTRPF